jgi:D-alanyl-D-alanine carboxypeptidase
VVLGRLSPRRLARSVGVGATLVLVATSVPGTNAAEAQVYTGRFLKAAHRITIEQGAKAGAALAMRGDEVVVDRGWNGASSTLRYRIASISKVLTATTVLSMAEQGLVALDAPLYPQLQGGVAPPRDARLLRVTVRQFLSHTTGIGTFREPLFGPITRAKSCQGTAEMAARKRLASRPGTYRYSNVNFCYLHVLIEVVSGVSYEDAVNARVWAPLGIVGPYLGSSTLRHEGDGRYTLDRSRRYLEAIGGAGQWVASLRELAAVFNALDPTTPGVKLLAPQTLSEMKHAITHTPDGWGYGLGMRSLRGAWGHTGTLTGVRIIAMHAPDGTNRIILALGAKPNSAQAMGYTALTAL